MFVIGLVLAYLAAPVRSQDRELEFVQALRTERVTGDLAAAAAIYKSIANDPAETRDLRARAGLRWAQAFEQLGDSRALTVYRRLAAEYSDFPRVVSVAAERAALLTPRPAPTAPSATGPVRLGLSDTWQDWGIQHATLAPGGTLFAGIDPVRRTLWIENLEDGSRIPVTPDVDRSNAPGAPDSPRFDLTESRLAYVLTRTDGIAEVRVYHLSSRSTAVIMDISGYFDGDAGEVAAEVWDWTPGGDRLLVSMTGLRTSAGSVRAEHVLGLVTIETGLLEVLAEAVSIRPTWRDGCIPAEGTYVIETLSESGAGTGLQVLNGAGKLVRELPNARLLGCRKTRSEVVWISDLMGDSGLMASEVTAGAPLAPRTVGAISGEIEPVGLSEAGTAVFTLRPQRGLEVVRVGLNPASRAFNGQISPLRPKELVGLVWGVGHWSKDGRLAVGNSDGTRLHVYEPTGAEEMYELPIRARTRGVRNRWLSGGNRIVTSYWADDSESGQDETFVLDLDTQQNQRYLGFTAWESAFGGMGVYTVAWEAPGGTCVQRVRFDSQVPENVWCATSRLWNINLTPSPSGELLAVTHQHEQTGWTIRLMRPDGSENRVLLETQTRAHGPTRIYWAGDDKYIYFTSGFPEHRIWEMNLATGARRELLEDLRGVLEFSGFNVSPDRSQAIVRARYKRLSEEQGPFVMSLK
jgi:hypothetical protein